MGGESSMCGVHIETRVHRGAATFARSDSSSPRRRGPSVSAFLTALAFGGTTSLTSLHPLIGRGASHFLCLAKESNQRNARPRRRPLRGCPVLLRSAGRRPNSHDRAARATCFGQRAPEFPAALALLGVFEGRQDNCSPLSLTLSPSGERGSPTAHRSVDLALDLPALEDAEQRRAGRGGRSHTVRSTWRRAAAIVRVCATAGLTEQHRGPPQAASSRARLSLVTFFGKTKKVTGPAAVKRVVTRSAARKPRCEERTSEDAKAETLGSRLRGNDDALDSRLRGIDTSLRSSRSPTQSSLRGKTSTSASPC